MRLQKKVLQLVDQNCQRREFQAELENIQLKVNGRDKINFINLYLCYSNLFEMDLNFTQHCMEFKDSFGMMVDCIERNKDKFSNIKYYYLTLEVFELCKGYTENLKAIRLVS